jgi:DNA excision repair protein ERCC-2
MKCITLSVGDFALPAPRKGSIEALSGFGASNMGIEIHQRVQAQRKRQFPQYQAEVATSFEFERQDYRFLVGGRVDGILPGSSTRFEEIKSSFAADELAQRLMRDPHHPFCLQLRTYGYFHWRKTGEMPHLTFHLVSTRSWKTRNLDLALELEDYEAWLKRRMDELIESAQTAERRVRARQKTAGELQFPFAQPRAGQMNLMDTVEQGLVAKERMLLQAPTGLGKTMGVIFPTLREALARGQKVIYVTPKNSQHAVAEEALEQLRSRGQRLKSLTITAKNKICLKSETLCNPQYCEFAKDHYTKVSEAKLPVLLSRKRKLTAKTFRALGRKHMVCPFELQWESAKHADVVICDYNYVFAPRASGGRLLENDLLQEGQPNLVIDEAHNLPFRAMDYYSPAMSSRTLRGFRERLQQLAPELEAEAQQQIDECLSILEECRPSGKTPALCQPPVARFYEQDTALRNFLARYIESASEIQARDPVLALSFYWSGFLQGLEVLQDANEFFATFHDQPHGAEIKITCCDASQFLRDTYEKFEQVVAFSATLKPFEFYQRMSGLGAEALRIAEFTSPFPKERRKLLIIPQISSKFSERERNYPRIAETIERIIALKPGNYFAFFPSFSFLEQVWSVFKAPSGVHLCRQERAMRSEQIEAVLKQLKNGENSTLVFAVQGGVFAEGVDYPGQMLIGAFVVGPPLPTFALEREEMRAYYQRLYGSGLDYAYTIPAMSKAVQAAGRVIRSPTDHGLIVLMDNRFLLPNYSQAMPQDWFSEGPKELVSQSILSDVSAFWRDLE